MAAAPVKLPTPEELLSGDEPLLTPREEYDLGKSWLSKPVIPGAGWPAADRAVGHFSRAAALDSTNSDYAMQAGAACLVSIERFLQSWGEGPLVTVAALLADEPLGQEIDRSLNLFRGSPLTAEHRSLLRTRASEALQWYARAMSIDPQDSVTRASRAVLLSRIGAFGPALSEAGAVLSSPLTPSNARQQAQEVTDYLLGDNSPLRKFLTRSEAQRLQGPAGLDLHLAAARPEPEPPPPPPPPQPVDLFALSAPPPPSPVDGMFGGMGSVATDTPVAVVAPSLRRKRRGSGGGGFLKFAIPLLFLGGLLGGLGYYVWKTEQPVYNGSLTAEAWDDLSLKKLLRRNTFPCAADAIERMLTTLQTDPIILRSQLRFVQFSGTADGMEVLLRCGEEGRFVRVNLLSQPALGSFVKERLAGLETERQKSVMAAQAAFCGQWENEPGQPNLEKAGSFIDSLGGDALVGGLGYHTAANVGGKLFPCVYEDEEGRLYYLVPRSTTQLRIVEKPGEKRSVLPEGLAYDVTITQVTAPPAAPAKEGEAKDGTEAADSAAPDAETADENR